MTARKTQPRTMKNNGIGYYSQRAVENNKQTKHSQEAESQPNQGKFPHAGVWGSGNICLARLQSLCVLLCPPIFLFRKFSILLLVIMFLSLCVITYLFSATGSRGAASKNSLPDIIVYQEILGFETDVVTG